MTRKKNACDPKLEQDNTTLTAARHAALRGPSSADLMQRVPCRLPMHILNAATIKLSAVGPQHSQSQIIISAVFQGQGRMHRIAPRSGGTLSYLNRE